MPPYVTRRRNGCYFRARISADFQSWLGKNVVVSLRTSDPKIAHQRVATVLKTFRDHMSRASDIDRDILIQALQGAVLSDNAVPVNESHVGRAIKAMTFFSQPGVGKLLESNLIQAEKLAALRSIMKTGKPPEPVSFPKLNDPDDMERWLNEIKTRSAEVAEDLGYVGKWFEPNDEGTSGVVSQPEEHGKAWQTFLDEFWKDNPGYSVKSISGMKTTFSYLERVWKRKALSHIVKRDLVEFSDFLRDFTSSRGNKPLSHKTIQRQLGEVRNFLRWAVGKDYLKDDGFQTVQARKPTQEEKNAESRRRAFTHAELESFFYSPEIIERKRDDRWWTAILLAMTGARESEILSAPSELVMIG
ncbi:hypothetical protein SACS_1197 [Parasaccharibacter apium]|uniref:Core-binding (CB) domain-containing protein n=2 Tax=Parasaccharibacter apium TaxID=1510841 RepID=A0A7U7J0V3_9PROT|nr:hypothetical protein SACS_1197 [Parasaccharibacter apium]